MWFYYWDVLVCYSLSSNRAVNVTVDPVLAMYEEGRSRNSGGATGSVEAGAVVGSGEAVNT